jgi:hypothetical protein
VPSRSDKPTTRKPSTRKPAIVNVDPATQRAPNADEAAPETLVPEVVRTNLSREAVSGDADRGRWIAARAYELAQARGFAPGSELDDWLQAEREYDAKGPAQTRPEDQFTG